MIKFAKEVLKIDKVLIVLISTFLLLVAGCAEQKQPQQIEKGQCKRDSDCMRKACSIVSCVASKCKYNPTENCCGNKIKDAEEDGKPGNKCTCPEDYGKCEGIVKVKIGNRNYDSENLKYFCENDQCKIGVPRENVRPVTLLDEREFGVFKLETTATYNEPFDINRDAFTFRISLKDHTDEIKMPIKINKITIKEGEILFGGKDLDIKFDEIGESSTVNVPFIYKLEQPEETKSLTYKIDYEYISLVKGQKLSNGSYIFEEQVVRDNYQKKFTTKIAFFKSGVAE